MMINDNIYKQTKIYKITSFVGDKIYIGSTTKKHLCDRMANHRYGYKKWKNQEIRKVTSFDIFDEYGLDNCKIILIENYPCNNKDEKNSREAHWIKTTECVNKIVPGRTDKQYFEDNKEKIMEYQKKYQQEHKELYSKSQREHYQRNKEAIDAKRNVVIQCECGGHYVLKCKSRHLITAKHKKYIEDKEKERE